MLPFPPTPPFRFQSETVRLIIENMLLFPLCSPGGGVGGGERGDGVEANG